MQLSRRIPLFLCLAALLLTPASGETSTIRYRTDAELIAMSERVVHARVVRQHTERPDPNGAIYTVTTLAVIEDLTGVAGDTVEVRELGGTFGNEIMYVGGAVEYAVGSEVLVCLERGPRGLRSVAMGFSKFEVIGRTPTRPGRLARAMKGTTVVGGQLPAAERSLDEFRALARQTTGRAPRRSAGAAGLLTNDGRTALPFTYLDPSNPLRWREADSGTPVVWYVNTSAAAPTQPLSDGVAETQSALAAWTNPPSATIRLQYGGKRLETQLNGLGNTIGNADGPWQGIPNTGTGLVTFEDPYDELPPGALGIGGGFGDAVPGSGGVVNGTTFMRFLRGFAIIQNAADLQPEEVEPANFTRILTHETGHGIGLGHNAATRFEDTPANTANIMFPFCCYDNTPAAGTIGPDDLAGLTFIYPAPAMALDRTVLQFAGVNTGAQFTWQTSSQIVRLTQDRPGTVTWTATSDKPWLTVSPASGSGTADLSVRIGFLNSLPLSGTDSGTITLTFNGAANNPGPITVGITSIPQGSNSLPFGFMDTPLDNTTGVVGSIPVTGWAMDDVEIVKVEVHRDPLPGEATGGFGTVYIGDAVLVEGARPDVAAAFPNLPRFTRAGWGYLMLTNMLPNQGNGSFRLHAVAFDREGNTRFLRGLPTAASPNGVPPTITATNASSIDPFGAIDTPAQGQTVSGVVDNFGWVLISSTTTAPGTRADVPGGGTVFVVIDGSPIAVPGGWTNRSDLSSIFPTGFSNLASTLAVHTFDTTTLTNGVHTIAWGVTATNGQSAGIGSRYFTVSNGFSAPSASAAMSRASSNAHKRIPIGDEIGAAPLDSRAISGRRGFNLDAPFAAFEVGDDGRVVVESEEIDRIELQLGIGGSSSYTGHMRTGNTLGPLPIGSRLDAATGAFTWQPGVGFVGSYDLVFVRWEDGRAVARQEVRIVLNPKSSGRLGPQVVIDTPTAQAEVGQPFVIAGWAADMDQRADAGVGAVHVWAYPHVPCEATCTGTTWGAPLFVGAEATGGTRPDVAAIYGAAYRNSGYGVVVKDLAPGTYDLAVFAWSTLRSDFVPAKLVRVTVK